MTVNAGQVLTAEEFELETLPGRIIPGGRGRRTTNSSASSSTTPVGVLRLDGLALTAGRIYEIRTSPLAADSTVANDVIRAQILYDTTGASATTSSSALPGGMSQDIQVNAAQSSHPIISTTYTPASDETVSLLLCLLRATGSGSCTLQADGTTNIIEITVKDAGVDPGDTGVDV